MRVVSITLYGFKSFAEKTTIPISSDLNTIVGPNGCGKSNVVEAVLWVLGEQSAKQLRGMKMDDVIFSGSKEKRPAQFAEVSITFDNRDHYLPVEYEEVCISRKLFRTGESEYTINRIPVRLRDIQELFSSSGLSRQSFAIIGQGKVDEFIRQSPQERRQMLDEISGVAKFFQKRKDAAKKLEASQVNVDRVNDLVLEIETQADKLQDQVSAAKTWSEKKELLDQLEIKKKAVQYEKVLREFQVVDTDYTNIQAEYSLLQSQFAEREKVRIVQLEAVKVLENVLQRAQEKQHKVEVTKTLYDGEKKRIESAIQRISIREKEVEVYSKDFFEKQQQRQKEATLLEEKLKERGEEKKSLQEKINFSEKARALVHSDIEQALKKYDLERVSFTDLQTKVNTLAIEEKFLLKRKQEKETLLVTVKRTLETTNEQLKKIQHEDTSARKNEIEALKEEIDEKKKKISHITETLHLNESTLKQNEHELALALSNYETIRARKEAMVRMKENFIDVHEDIRKFFQQIGIKTKSERIVKKPICCFPLCLLSDFLHTDLLDQSITVLSFFDALYNTTVVVNRFEDAETIFKLAEKEAIRGLSCIVLEAYASEKQVKHFTESNQWLMSSQELLTVLLDKLSIQTEHTFELAKNVYQQCARNAVSSPLLHSKWFIDPLFVLRLSPQYEHSFKGGTSVGRFTGEKEILLLEKEIEKQQRQLQSLRTAVDALKSNIQQSTQERASLNESMRKLDMNLVHANFHLTQIEQKKKELDAIRNEKTAHAESFNSEIKEIDLRLTDLSVEKSKIEKELTQFRDRIQTIEKELELKRDEVLVKDSELKRLRSDLNIRQEHIQELEKQKLRLQTLEEERVAAEERMRDELNMLSVEKQSLMKEKDRTLKELEDSQQLLEAFSKELQIANNELQERRKEFSDTLKQYHGLDKAKQSLENKHTAILEARSKKLAQVDILREEYQVATQDYLAHATSILKENILTSFSDEIKAWDQEYIQLFLTKSSHEIQTLKEWLDSHKSINFHAEDEYIEVAQRLQSLKHELQDLEMTKQSIIELIDDLETKSRLEFMAAYELIRARFKENFTTLFDGGEADLLLIGSDSIMDAGIELKASPPGKEMKSLHLLSGGERCLTALALLFSLFQVKKAPLCLLDEVDAPLDEVNVVRFNKLLKQCIETTQFILVTHNKRTMASSSKLIGVSMREKGVSCILSVELSQNNQEKKEGQYVSL